MCVLTKQRKHEITPTTVPCAHVARLSGVVRSISDNKRYGAAPLCYRGFRFGTGSRVLRQGVTAGARKGRFDLEPS